MQVSYRAEATNALAGRGEDATEIQAVSTGRQVALMFSARLLWLWAAWRSQPSSYRSVETSRTNSFVCKTIFVPGCPLLARIQIDWRATAHLHAKRFRRKCSTLQVGGDDP